MSTGIALPEVPPVDPEHLPLDEPSVVDDGEVRRLYFGPAYVQSEMSRADPFSLSLVYTRKMMAFLLFVPKPRDVVIVGLGGGSLSKFCWQALPKARITTIEIDPRVIALAPVFGVPVEDARMRIIEADACDWLARTDMRMDVVMLDGYTEAGIAGGFATPEFYAALRARLRPGGVLAANILVGNDAFRRYREAIGAAFDGQLLVQRVVPDGNHVVLAFDRFPDAPDWVAIAREAKLLQQRHGLDFPAFARTLRRQHERAETGPFADDGVALL